MKIKRIHKFLIIKIETEELLRNSKGKVIIFNSHLETSQRLTKLNRQAKLRNPKLKIGGRTFGGVLNPKEKVHTYKMVGYKRYMNSLF